MTESPVNSYSMRWSLAIHGCLFAAMFVHTVCLKLWPPKVEPPQDFTIVLPPSDILPQPEPEQAKEEPEEEPPEPEEPEPVPEPPAPVKDAVAIEKKKEPPKKKEEPKPKPKPEPPKKKPFVKGKHIEAPKPKPVKPTVDFTKFKRVVTQTPIDKPLSEEEIRNALNAGARIGTRNQIPDNEMSRCIVLVKNALYDAWEQPSEADAGKQPARLEIRLDLSGRITSYRITQSSGSQAFDQTVLKAAANTDPIRGLSLDFLKQFERLTVEFKLQ